jgi:putative transposase
MKKRIVLKTMNQGTALATGTLALPPLVIEGLEEFKGSFDRLCLRAGTAAIEAMLAADAEQLCGKRYQRHVDRRAYRWGLVGSEIGWHGGKAAIRRLRVRQRGGTELQLASWKAIQEADLLSRWAFNQMLIGVATRKYARSVRLPDGDLAGQAKRSHNEVLGITAFRGAEHGEAEGMAGD